jgi:transcriptional adapter 2-alpha
MSPHHHHCSIRIMANPSPLTDPNLTTSNNPTASRISSSTGALYHCDYCRRDISSTIRIRCVECSDFDLCLDCFSCGYSLPPHVNTHSYRVVEHVRQPIYESQWGADEELLLLEAIEMFGFGNWADISDHIGTKNKIQCELHYEEVYLNSKNAPLPDVERILIQESHNKYSLPSNPIDTSNQQLPAVNLPNPILPKAKPRSGLGHLVGYIPARGDFDTEYDNDAELILADMEFKAEDSKWEKELKLKVLDIYNSKLDARFERKKFILERGLLERKEKKRSKDEREIYNNLRVFARFHSAPEHEQFIQGLLNELRLRKRIEQLQTYRLNGIKTLADAEIFENERKKREIQAGNAGQAAASSLSSSNKLKQNKDLSSTGSNNLTLANKRSAEELGSSDEKLLKISKKESNLNSSTAANLQLAKAQSSSPALLNSTFSIDGLAGVELLSEKERQLCLTLQLIPQHYLSIKNKLIKEILAKGYIKENQAKQLIKIDINKTQKIFDFFVSVGWINTHNIILNNLNSNNTNIKQETAGKQPQLTVSNK